MPIARPAPKSPVKASVAAAPAKPPVGSLMDRPMGPGGNLPMRPMPSTPAVQTSRPGPQIGSPVPVTPQPIRPGLGQGSVGQLQQAQLGQATPMGGGLQGIGPRASELSMDQLLKMQREMGQQADLQQQNALSKIPAYAQMQALQGQLQGRQPTPQELQQLRMYDQQIQSDPGFRQMQGNLQQMGQQFEQQYGGQLQKMQQAQYAGPMGPGSAGPGAMPPPSLDTMYRPGSMPTVLPQQRQQQEMEMARMQQMAMQQMQPFNQQPMQQARPLGPQQGMLQGFQQQPPVQPPQSFGQPQQVLQAAQSFGPQFSATLGQPQQAQQFSQTLGSAQPPAQVGGQQAQQMGLGGPQQARPAGGGIM